jgi:cytochrome b561
MAQDIQLRNRVIIECLHWLIVFGFIWMILVDRSIGMRYHDPSMLGLLKFHHFLAVTLLLLMLIRLIWQWVSAPLRWTPVWQYKLTKLSYAFFYIVVLMSILCRWFMSMLRGEVTSSVLFFHVKTAVPQAVRLERSLGSFYHFLIWIAVILLILQIALFIYHYASFIKTITKEGRKKIEDQLKK